MKRRARWNHASAFKAKVALAAVKGDRTIAQLAEQHPEPDHVMESAVELPGYLVLVVVPRRLLSM